MARPTDNKRDFDKGSPEVSSYWKDPVSANKKYNADQFGKASNKFFRSFYRTRFRATMNDYDDVRYLTVAKNYWDFQDGGNGETAFQAWMGYVWNRGTPAGEKKDLDSTQETNFLNYISYTTSIACELLAQKNLREVSNSLTEDSGTGMGTGSLAYWDQEDFDTFVRAMERFDYFPNFSIKFANLFCGPRVKITDGYTRAKTVIPPSYLLLQAPDKTLSELEAYRTGCNALATNSKIHMNKFKIPYSKFSYDALKSRECTWEDPDVQAICNHGYYSARLAGATIYVLPGDTGGAGDMYTNTTTSWTGRDVFWTDDKGPQSIIHALAPIMVNKSLYHATNSPFAMASDSGPSNTEGHTNFLCIAEDDTTETEGQFMDADEENIIDILMRYWATWRHAAPAGDFAPAIVGTGVTADEEIANDVGRYIAYFAVHGKPNQLIGNGVSQSEWIDNAIYAGIHLMYGS
jgi:hypothetical protein